MFSSSLEFLLRPFVHLTGLILFSFSANAAPLLNRISDATDPQYTDGSSPTSFYAHRGSVYFSAFTPNYGYELWKSDGTPEGTSFIKDLYPGSGSSDPMGYFTILDELYFFTAGGKRGIWKTDGTSQGTIRIKELPYLSSGWNRNPVQIGDQIYFSCSNSYGRSQLWTSDGTEAGTHVVKEMADSAADQQIKGLVAAGDAVFFITQSIHDTELWTSNGSAEGTHRIKVFATKADHAYYRTVLDNYPVEFNGRYCFVAPESPDKLSLWISDGTEDGTIILKSGIDDSSNPQGHFRYSSHGQFIYFNGSSDRPWELWRSNGTASGTESLKDIRHDDEGKISRFHNNSKTLYFEVETEGTTLLWSSDGTSGGTGPSYSTGYNSWENAMLAQIASEDSTYFLARDRIIFINSNAEDIQSIPVGSPYRSLSSSAALLNGNLFLSYYSEETGGELAILRPNGTKIELLRKEISINDYDDSQFALIGDQLFFSKITANEGTELWRSDGTMQGTYLVKDIRPGPTGYVNNFAIKNGKLVFVASNQDYGSEIWESDGTEPGTKLLHDIVPGPSWRTFSEFSVINDRLYFATGENEKITLWGDTGANNEPRPIRDFAYSKLGNDGLTIGRFAIFSPDKSSLYFHATDPVLGYGFWKSDGTAAGTQLVKSLVEDPITPDSEIAIVDQTIYFMERNAWPGSISSPNTYSLWKTEVGQADATLVKAAPPIPDFSLPPFPPAFPPTAVGKSIFFMGGDLATGQELWKTDGTEEGTVLLRDFNHGPESSVIRRIEQMGNLAYFCVENIPDVTLWKSDGTPEGTTPVKTLGRIQDLKAIGNNIYFIGYDETHGEELWMSDGTATGTKMIEDLTPGSGGSVIANLIGAGDRAFFTAYSEEKGRELYVYQNKTTENTTFTLGEASSLSRNSAVIKGDINPNGKSTTAYLEYGVVGGSSSQTPIILPRPDSAVPQSFSLELTGLEKTTAYQYRLVVSNSSGNQTSEVMAFTTPDNRPPLLKTIYIEVPFATETMIDAATLLAGASDPDADDLQIVSVVGMNATLDHQTVRYQPAPDFFGVDRFSITVADRFGASSVAEIIVEVESPFGKAAQSELRILPGGDKALRFKVTPGRTCRVLRSQDLKNWKMIAEVSANASGEIDFTDPDPPSGSAFYRLAYP